MSDHELRWGILGSAKITQLEVGPAMVKTARSKVFAVGSPRPGAADDLAAQLGAVRSYDSYEAVLADPEVNSVYIPLPNTAHTEWTIRALEAGKNVLVEKPMSMTGDEARAILAAASASGTKVMEGFMYRFHPRIERVRELLDNGAIGDIALVRATYTIDLGQATDVRSGTLANDLRLNPALGGGVLTDLGSYCSNGLRLYAGSRPKRVVSWCSSSPGREVETRMSGEVEFDNGVIGQFFAALDVPGGGHIEILGSGGRITLANAFRLRADQGPVRVDISTPDGTVSEILPFLDQYELEIEHFAALVLDEAKPVIPLDDSLDNAILLESIRRSWTDGPVTVPVR